MKVTLSHDANPDIACGYWSEMNRPNNLSVEVSSFEQAGLECRNFIEKYDLGGGNWTGGAVCDDTGKQIAKVSYNGRIWDMQDQEITI